MAAPAPGPRTWSREGTATGARRGGVLLLAALFSMAAPAPACLSELHDPARSPLAPYRFSAPPTHPTDRVPMQNYRSDLEGRRFQLERRGDPMNLRQQEELRDLRHELNRMDRLTGQ